MICRVCLVPGPELLASIYCNCAYSQLPSADKNRSLLHNLAKIVVIDKVCQTLLTGTSYTLKLHAKYTICVGHSLGDPCRRSMSTVVLQLTLMP